MEQDKVKRIKRNEEGLQTSENIPQHSHWKHPEGEESRESGSYSTIENIIETSNMEKWYLSPGSAESPIEDKTHE